jgi:biopolymer transport protein ExbD
VLNVKKDGSFWFGGARRNEQEVKDALAVEARLSRNADGISDRVVLVKADRRVRFEAIRKLIILCVDRNIRIWRLAFGTLPRKSSGPVAE